MTIYDQIKELLKDKTGSIISTLEVKKELYKKFNTNASSIILSDYCYNRFNAGINFDKHIFHYINQSSYKYLGENYNYTGLIFHKPKGSKHELIVGEWQNGKKCLYEKPINNNKDKQDINDLTKISRNQIAKLYEEYNEILRMELKLMRCKPTELRHLIGRIGEFYCAIETNGYLTKRTNQQGFDVVSNNRRISVKTTAQSRGFITINQNTFDLFDDLFVVQYREDDFKLIFHGVKEKIKDISRIYGTNYEVDISKLKKINKK